PTGYMAAEACDIRPGDIVAVWGCGPVGLFAIKSAYLLGAERVIAIDRIPERLRMAQEQCGAIALNYEEIHILDALRELTGGRGPDACIDAVGMEAHSHHVDFLYDRAKQALMLETDRPTVLREAIMACRPGGTLSVPGVYGGGADKPPIGALMTKSLTVKTGQTHVHRYLKPLLEYIEQGAVDASCPITHTRPLEEASQAYKLFRDKQNECIKVVLKPW